MAESLLLVNRSRHDKKETSLTDYKNLNHTKWECKYHVGFIPKYREKSIYQQPRKCLGELFHDLAGQKECRVEEGHLREDHVHMMIRRAAKISSHSRERFFVRIRASEILFESEIPGVFRSADLGKKIPENGKFFLPLALVFPRSTFQSLRLCRRIVFSCANPTRASAVRSSPPCPRRGASGIHPSSWAACPCPPPAW